MPPCGAKKLGGADAAERVQFDGEIERGVGAAREPSERMVRRFGEAVVEAFANDVETVVATGYLPGLCEDTGVERGEGGDVFRSAVTNGRGDGFQAATSFRIECNPTI